MVTQLFGNSVQAKTLETPIKCIMVAGLLFIMILSPIFLGILGIPIDVALAVFALFIGKDFFGLGGIFKGLGGIFK